MLSINLFTMPSNVSENYCTSYSSKPQPHRIQLLLEFGKSKHSEVQVLWEISLYHRICSQWRPADLPHLIFRQFEEDSVYKALHFLRNEISHEHFGHTYSWNAHEPIYSTVRSWTQMYAKIQRRKRKNNEKEKNIQSLSANECSLFWTDWLASQSFQWRS